MRRTRSLVATAAAAPTTTAVLFAMLPATPLLADDCGCDSDVTSLTVTGIVRDFKEGGVSGGHVDFERTISTGSGHYAGNMELFAPNHKPVFKGGGKKVTGQCTDALGRPIPPHLCNKRFATGAEQPPQATMAILADAWGVDAYEIRFLSATFNENGTSSWSYNVRELPTGKDLSHWLLVVPPSVQVMAGTTPGYQLGVDGSTGFYGIKWDVNDSFNEEVFTIVLDQHYDGSDSQCSVVAKGGPGSDEGDLFAPTSTVAQDGSPFQVADGLITDLTLNDGAASYGVSSNGGIGSAWTFRDWYRDNPPTNMSRLITLELLRQDDCTYLFDASQQQPYTSRGGFFPVDGELLGNSGGSPDHNFHFTCELHVSFTYDETAEQYLRFTGDDDVWVFVDGKLAIDLGGIHGPLDQRVPLERMGLSDGETYEIAMFFAERHRTQSNFRIETNFCFESLDPVVVSAIFD